MFLIFWIINGIEFESNCLSYTYKPTASEISDNINAAKYFKSILKINYDYSKAHNMLVKTYINLGRFREAKKECDILFMLDTSLYNSLEYCKN